MARSEPLVEMDRHTILAVQRAIKRKARKPRLPAI